jgi:hypothetical protein
VQTPQSAQAKGTTVSADASKSNTTVAVKK